MAKWVLRRSSIEEKILSIVKYRQGHKCATAWIVVAMVAWEGVPTHEADRIYSLLTHKLNRFGLPTTRRCGTNEPRTCACQGLDPDTCGASYSFGCSWSMYYNGCKYARSKTVRKFRLSVKAEEQEVEERMHVLATLLSPLYLSLAPEAFNNQTQFEREASECRLGFKPGRPFSGVTACIDFCAHSHRDLHNMNNGCTVVVSLTKHRTLSKPEDEQLHILPLYVMDETDEFGSKEGQQEKIKSGAVEQLTKYPCEVRVRSVPLQPCRRHGKKRKEDEPDSNPSKKEPAKIIEKIDCRTAGNFPDPTRLPPRGDSQLSHEVPPMFDSMDAQLQSSQVSSTVRDSPVSMYQGWGYQNEQQWNRNNCWLEHQRKNNWLNPWSDYSFGNIERNEVKVDPDSTSFDDTRPRSALSQDDYRPRSRNLPNSTVLSPRGHQMSPRSSLPCTPGEASYAGSNATSSPRALSTPHDPKMISPRSSGYPPTPGELNYPNLQSSPCRNYTNMERQSPRAGYPSFSPHLEQRNISTPPKTLNYSSGNISTNEQIRNQQKILSPRIIDQSQQPRYQCTNNMDENASRLHAQQQYGVVTRLTQHPQHIGQDSVHHHIRHSSIHPMNQHVNGNHGDLFTPVIPTNSNHLIHGNNPPSMMNHPQHHHPQHQLNSHYGHNSNEQQTKPEIPMISSNNGNNWNNSTMDSTSWNLNIPLKSEHQSSAIINHHQVSHNEQKSIPSWPDRTIHQQQLPPPSSQTEQHKNLNWEVSNNTASPFRVPKGRPPSRTTPNQNPSDNNVYNNSFNRTTFLKPQEPKQESIYSDLHSNNNSNNNNTNSSISLRTNCTINSPNEQRKMEWPEDKLREGFHDSRNQNIPNPNVPWTEEMKQVQDFHAISSLGHHHTFPHQYHGYHPTYPTFDKSYSNSWDGFNYPHHHQPYHQTTPEYSPSPPQSASQLYQQKREHFHSPQYSYHHHHQGLNTPGWPRWDIYGPTSYFPVLPEPPPKAEPLGEVADYSDNEECFKDSQMGGVAIALGHGSVLFECAKHEMHSTTALKKPNRLNPTRISLVFYQHRNLNRGRHGWSEWEEKMRLRKLGVTATTTTITATTTTASSIITTSTITTATTLCTSTTATTIPASTTSMSLNNLNTSSQTAAMIEENSTTSTGDIDKLQPLPHIPNVPSSQFMIKSPTYTTMTWTTLFPMHPCMITGPYQEGGAIG
ncbi:hypothetical protein PV327_007590 [Microctonus hyperodae]|uniref:Methylcytosine dioxygenase TET n=1 Tax=Microctonus hyperodae TaxID=165561 RepID=A0AA39FZI0_MICHY|nr:hypothetical protein PV327_007590 [Microctonus hyperodae]